VRRDERKIKQHNVPWIWERRAAFMLCQELGRASRGEISEGGAGGCLPDCVVYLVADAESELNQGRR
jgi:hypothetical protein